MCLFNALEESNIFYMISFTYHIIQTYDFINENSPKKARNYRIGQTLFFQASPLKKRPKW